MWTKEPTCLTSAALRSISLNEVKMVRMRTKIAKVLGTSVLAGSPQGRDAMLRLKVLVERPQARPTAWLWDCQGVDACSHSFGRECFVTLQAFLRAQRSTLWPVIANASVDLSDDFRVIWKEAGTGIVTCRCDAAGRTSDVGLLGAVEPHLEATFGLVLARGATDARELKEAHEADMGIGQTAWNNRLAALAAMGALVEEPAGRVKRYRPIVGEGEDGR